MASLASMVLSLSWTMEPLQRQTNRWIGKLPLLPLFLFRMLSWVVIAVALKSFGTAVLIVLAAINFGILHGKTDQLFESAMLSMLFPAVKFPTSKMPNHFTEKAFFWLTIAGNAVLMATMVAVYILYLKDVMNPWCLADHILVPEEMLAHICFSMLILFFTSTFPIFITKLVEKDRQV